MAMLEATLVKDLGTLMWAHYDPRDPVTREKTAKKILDYLRRKGIILNG